SIMRDIKFATRQLFRNPGFTMVSVLTLALGIGANTAIFSVIYALFIRPLPIPDATRVVQVWEAWRGEGTAPVAWAKFVDWRQQVKSFEAIAGCNWGDGFTLTGGERPQIVQGRTVSAGFFEVLGVMPTLGRTFEVSDAKPGSEPVAV